MKNETWKRISNITGVIVIILAINHLFFINYYGSYVGIVTIVEAFFFLCGLFVELMKYLTKSKT